MAKKIVIVDDDQDFTDMTSAVLKAAGYEVVCVNDPAEAENVISEEKPDIALVDLMMDEPDAGFVLCYKFKQKYKDMPIIMMSAVENETGIAFDAVTSEEKSWINVDAFLHKPVRNETLLNEIKQLTINNDK